MQFAVPPAEPSQSAAMRVAWSTINSFRRCILGPLYTSDSPAERTTTRGCMHPAMGAAILAPCVTGIYARWHMFEEKREAVVAIEAAVLPLMPEDRALAA
jgi:hypothetical protein